MNKVSENRYSKDKWMKVTLSILRCIGKHIDSSFYVNNNVKKAC